MNIKPKDPFKNTNKIYCYIKNKNIYCEIDPFLYFRQKTNIKDTNLIFNNPVLIKFNNEWLAIPANKFNYPVYFGSKIMKIDQSFLRNCKNFNHPLDMSNCKNIKKIDSNFLNNCWKFNSVIKLPPNIKSIEKYFMFRCKEFNKNISLPNTIKIINENFLSQCKNFNSKLNFNNTKNLVKIDRNFLSNNFNYSQNLKIPQSVKYIGRNFLLNCNKFNFCLLLPSQLEYLGLWFLKGTKGSINKSVPLPISLKKNDKLFYDKVIQMHNEGLSYSEIEQNLPNNLLPKEYQRLIGNDSYTIEYPIQKLIKYKMKQITDLYNWEKIKQKAI